MPNDFDFLDDLGQSKDSGPKQLSSLGEVFHRYGTLFIDSIHKSLEKKIVDAETSKIWQDINFDVEITGLKYRFTISMPEYWYYVDQGRSAGKRPPLRPIVDWILRKPTIKAAFGGQRSKLKTERKVKLKDNIQGQTKIDDLSVPKNILSAAYAVQNKISKKGTKQTRFYTDVMTEKAVEAFKNDIKKAIGKDIEITINSIAKSINGNNN